LLKRKVSKIKIKKERTPKKVKKVLEKKGYKKGKLPKDKELHHVNPVAEGGKTTPKNIKRFIRIEGKGVKYNLVEKKFFKRFKI